MFYNQRKKCENFDCQLDWELDFQIESVFGNIGKAAMYVKLILRFNRSIYGTNIVSCSKQKKEIKKKKKKRKKSKKKTKEKRSHDLSFDT